MIEIDIPTIDPIQHEPKIFVGMTSRQCLCIIPAAILGVGGFFLGFKMLGSMDVAIPLAMTLVAPWILLGWYAPYNMKFEQYVKLLYFNYFVAQQKRIYKTDNEQEVKMMTLKERQEEEQKMREKELAEKKKKKQTKSKMKTK